MITVKWGGENLAGFILVKEASTLCGVVGFPTIFRLIAIELSSVNERCREREQRDGMTTIANVC